MQAYRILGIVVNEWKSLVENAHWVHDSGGSRQIQNVKFKVIDQFAIDLVSNILSKLTFKHFVSRLHSLALGALASPCAILNRAFTFFQDG